MYGADETEIDAAHFNLLASHGEQVALIATVNLDVNSIVGVMSFHEYEGTYVLETVYPDPVRGSVDSYHHLLDYFGDAPDVVRKSLDHRIKRQRQSEDDTRFAWELIGGTDAVQSDDDLAETVSSVVGPERLKPNFEIPDGEPVAVLDVSHEGHRIIEDSNNRYAGMPVEIHRHRGQTYIIGLTEERARAIADACYRLQQDYKEQGLYDSAEEADRVEGVVLYADTETDSVTV